MSRPKILKLQDEVDQLIYKFGSNHFLLAEAFLQIIHRENILTGNRIRRRHGEEELIPQSVMYPKSNRSQIAWVIDVPKEWISMTGREEKWSERANI